nr:hypothetical protein [Candidatus Sigynarchaeota archaeon]
MESPDRAEALVKTAGELLAKNEMLGAFNNYKKAANLFMEAGSYFKVFEVFKMMSYIYKEQGKIGEMIQLVLDTAKKLEDFEVHDISARMYENAGTLSYDISDFENASEHFETAADLYQKMFDEEKNDDMRKLSGILLIKSAEAKYKLRTSAMKEKSEGLMLEGIFRFCALQAKIPELENKLVNQFNRAKLAEAKTTAESLTKAFRDAIEKLAVTTEFNVELLSANVKARIIHYKVEYQFLEYLLIRALEGNAKAAPLASNIIEKLQEAMNLLHGTMVKEFDKEDVDRYSFDGMLYAIVTIFSGGSADPIKIDAFTDGFGNVVKDFVKNNRYYQIMCHVMQRGLLDCKNELIDVNLGKLERVKPSIIKLLFSEA